MSEGGSDKSMQSVGRALAVLTALSDRREGVTFQQLHRELGIPLGSMHRVLGALEAEQFVARSTATKRYSLGPAALSLGYHEQYDTILMAPPQELIDLGRDTGETVFMTRMVDSRVICVSLVESRHPLRLYVRIGQEMPLHAAASARIILAHRDATLVEAILTAQRREAYTPGTMREVNQLIDRLAAARRRGFDVCSSELDDDVWAVAAPVFDSTGRVEYAVTLAAAAGRVELPERQVDYAKKVLAAAAMMSRGQGYSNSPNSYTAAELRELLAAGTDEHPRLSDKNGSTDSDV